MWNTTGFLMLGLGIIEFKYVKKSLCPNITSMITINSIQQS